MTIRDLKLRIYEKEGIPPYVQRLVFAGKQLETVASASWQPLKAGKLLRICDYNISSTANMDMHMGKLNRGQNAM